MFEAISILIGYHYYPQSSLECCYEGKGHLFVAYQRLDQSYLLRGAARTSALLIPNLQYGTVA